MVFLNLIDMKKVFSGILIFVLIQSISLKVSAQQADEWTKRLDLPGVTVTVFEQVTAGDYTVPGQRTPMKEMPAFVRVTMVSRPTPQSYIRIEVWLPQEWNGRYLGTGNGGGGGGIPYGSLELGVRYGFAVATTDIGTWPRTDSCIFKPERWADFGWRSTREMTVAAKALIEKYYGRSPQYSYFFGSSTGGQQALMTAQRFPDDYDGILCGAPANNRTHLYAMLLWNYRQLNRKPGMYLSKQQLEALTEAVLKRNAGKDGGHEGDKFLTDPRMATFNLDEMDFLTQDQKEAMKHIYAGPVNPSTGEPIFSPITLGSEDIAVIGLIEQQDSLNDLGALYPFRWVFGFDFDPMQFDFDKDMAYVDSLLAPVVNANNPDLTPFKAKGGKMLMYAGTADPLIPFQDAILYYDRVIDHFGGLEKVQDFYRFFVVPGLWHNNGGPGPCNIGQRITDLSLPSENNVFLTLIRWVEDGITPERIIGSNWEETVQMPLYPYPKFPHLITGQKPGIPASYQGVPHERGNVVIPASRYLK